MFPPDLVPHLVPLHRLLQKSAKWSWRKEEDASFSLVKEVLLQDKALVHYNPDLLLVIATDSSSHVLGAVVSQRTPEGESREPIAYASRSLSETERKYSQIEKDALSSVWIVKNFQTYLKGRHFYLVTDHQPWILPNQSEK